VTGFGTTSVHGGRTPEEPTGAVTTPIYRTSTFRFDTTDDLIAGQRGERPGFYTRYGNPNFAVVEAKFAALHGAEQSVLFSSGMAAMSAVLQATCRAGDRVVALRDVYGGTRDVLAWLGDRSGILTTWVPTQDRKALEAALPGARILVSESPTNPLLKILDLEAIAALCRKTGTVLLVDNTFASPVNQRPLASGARIVLESATKFLGGHADLVGGIVAADRETCAGLLKARKVLGANADPDAAWLLERGMKTLEVRVRRQNETGLEIARRLEKDRRVRRVLCPPLPSHPDHALAARLGIGCSGLVTFGCAGGADAARRLADSVRTISNAPSLGGVESLLSIPRFTSHAMFTPEERAAAGISDDLVRLSLGLEDVEDLWADLDRALS
jgi:cystathionine beta-lyase/cystathionine gamma-synthase